MDTAYSERLATLVLQERIGWGIAVISMVLFAFLMVRLGKRLSNKSSKKGQSSFDLQHRVTLHKSDSATASMEYLMVIVPFLVIVMTVWQLAFMLNARTHVGYSAFAAARSAAVLIPAEIESEKEGQLEKLSGDKSKWARIRRAAIPGTLAISPGAGTTAAGVAVANAVTSKGNFNPPGAPDAAVFSRLTLMSMHMCGTPIFCAPQALTGTRMTRAAIKDYYAQNMTTVYIQGKNHEDGQDLSNSDVIKIRVDYILWLQVPYVGRMLEAAIKGFKVPVTGDTIAINPYPSIVLSEETSINVWHKKRATTPCP